ncbi:MAG: hypothetical protein ACXWNX_15045 [Isosphaeraceae bacterium]
MTHLPLARSPTLRLTERCYWGARGQAVSFNLRAGARLPDAP